MQSMDSRNQYGRVHKIDDLSSDAGSKFKRQEIDMQSSGTYMGKVMIDDASSSGSYMVRADDLQSQHTIFEKPNRMDETVMSHGGVKIIDDLSSQGTNFFAPGGAN